MRGVSAIIAGENAGGLITLDGHVAGDAPAALALPYEGACYVGLQPDAPRFYGVTRKLVFHGGQLADCPPDAAAYDWDGLLEILLRCGELPPARERRFPFVAARLAFEGAQALLYYEDGLWLSIERNAQVQTGFFLHADAPAGELHVAGRTLFALARAERDACLALSERFEPLGRLEADEISVQDGAPTGIERLDSLRGYERKTRYAMEDGRLRPVQTETGFFTREPQSCALGQWFLEALLLGRDDEAAAMLAPSLGMGAEGVRAFLGEFTLVRPHPTNPRMAGIGKHTEGVTRMRALTFETEGDQIVNILEEA